MVGRAWTEEEEEGEEKDLVLVSTSYSGDPFCIFSGEQKKTALKLSNIGDFANLI